MDSVNAGSPGEVDVGDVAPTSIAREPSGATRRSVRWVRLVHWAWVGLLAVVAVRVAVTIRIYFLEVRGPCIGAACQGPPSMTAAQLRLLHGEGVSPELYAAGCAAVLVLFIAINCSISWLIVRRRPADRMAVLTAFTLLLFGGLSFGLPDQLFRQWEPLWWPPMAVFAWLGTVAIVVFLYLFPDGRPVPRWTAALVALWSVLQLPTYLAPDFATAAQGAAGPLGELLAAALTLGTFASLIYAQIYRYRRVSSPLQREQTKWVLYGIATALGGWISLLAFWNLSNVNAAQHPPLLDAASVAVAYALWLLIPLALGAAMLRYRLWDIDFLINRTLVYTALTGAVAGIYILTVGYLGFLFRTVNSLLISLLATGLVAVLFQPARQWLQGGVNRLMYGERDDPYAVLARLGRRLEGTLAPHAVLPAIVETITEALKFPYAAIELGSQPGGLPDAASGRPVSQIHTFPLTYRREEVGRLLVCARGGEEGFNPSDLLLLRDLALQAGSAVHALRLYEQTLRLAGELQRARERLVTTREEERRRLRRDLHDGIGPTLAGFTHRLDLVGDLVRTEPDAALPVLAELKGQVKTTVADIRRLVYGLRPPALDDFGLLPALREQVGRQTEGLSLRVTLDLPESLPSLPAAIEVAVYRIVLEAVTNVVRHAGAGTCFVRLTLDEDLCLSVEDDGRGFTAEAVPGVGLSSMRERAAELGGVCRIECRPIGGTAVRVSLPLGWE